jgi:23S rRNA pseudouridine1911/1915/1917 synthase
VVTGTLPAPKVVFEDEHVLVVDKPAGVTVHAGPGHSHDTLADALVAARPEMASVGQPGRPGVVHRLDIDTSGLLVFARTAAAYDSLVRMLKAREVKRTYTALVAGDVSPAQGVIEAPVGRDPSDRTRQAVVSTGKPARTRYRVLKQMKGAALIEVSLETGRMHQIRVHMAAVGRPVVGDRVYGARGQDARGLSRQFLHASRLEFNHPVTGEPVVAQSELPEDLAQALKEWDIG